MRQTQTLLLALMGVAAAAMVAAGWPRATAPPPVKVGAFATSLKGRTPNQRHNARLALEAIHDRVIPPGATFSFNKTCGSWSADRGYRKAPVSFEGELIPDWGGGVCQTSSTLYNAALLAGCPILERHRHQFAPRYIPPGRDAAVAQWDIDLRFKNPYPWPLRITGEVRGESLTVRLLGRERPARTTTAGASLERRRRWSCAPGVPTSDGEHCGTPAVAASAWSPCA
jgi:vancomycin resistance protein VanW